MLRSWPSCSKRHITCSATEEIKLDGFRAITVKSDNRVHLRSRNDKDFNGKYPAIVKALSAIPDETVLDGEVVALDESGRPSFNALQNYGSSATPVLYYVFDLLIVAGQDVTSASLADRRELFQARVLPTLDEPIRESPFLLRQYSEPNAASRFPLNGF